MVLVETLVSAPFQGASRLWEGVGDNGDPVVWVGECRPVARPQQPDYSGIFLTELLVFPQNPYRVIRPTVFWVYSPGFYGFLRAELGDPPTS